MFSATSAISSQKMASMAPLPVLPSHASSHSGSTAVSAEQLQKLLQMQQMLMQSAMKQSAGMVPGASEAGTNVQVRNQMKFGLSRIFSVTLAG
jgi:hypothetical protein